MAVAEMPSDARQRQRVGRTDLRQRLGRRNHFNDAPVLESQTVAAAQHRGFSEVEQEFEAANAGHDEAPAVAFVVIEHHRVGRRARPLAGGDDFVGAQHCRLSAARAAASSADPIRSTRVRSRSEGNASRPVSRVLYGRSSSPRRDGHSSGTPVAGRLEQPTRATEPTDKAPQRFLRAARRSYSVLLPAGLAMPPTLPPARCAFTAPFHPCRIFGPCGPPSGGLLSVALSLGSPPPDVIRRRIRLEPGLSSALSGGRPADWLKRAYVWRAGAVKDNQTRRMETAPGPRTAGNQRHRSFIEASLELWECGGADAPPPRSDFLGDRGATKRTF
jgi:hypothetical protein